MADLIERLHKVIFWMEAEGLGPESEVVAEGIREVERLRPSDDARREWLVLRAELTAAERRRLIAAGLPYSEAQARAAGSFEALFPTLIATFACVGSKENSLLAPVGRNPEGRHD